MSHTVAVASRAVQHSPGRLSPGRLSPGRLSPGRLSPGRLSPGRLSPDTHKRRHAERAGRLAEHLAAFALMLRGYRILARRCITAAGEIDIVAVRGRRIAFVEVKQRATWGEAEIAVRARQTGRLQRAAEQWVAARPYYRDHEQGFDSLLVVPGSWPEYRRDALQPV